MALNFQVVIDCKNPHVLADWWAETLEWIVEPQDEAFIRSMVDQGFATEEETTTHNGKLVWKDGAAIGPEEDQDKDDVRVALEARGAKYLWTAKQGPHEWHTMADPEGNEFCIS